MVTISTTDDLLRAARENPEFRAAFQREIMTQEVLDLPDRIDKYSEKTDKELASLTESVTTLTNQVASFIEATNNRLNRIEIDLGELKGIGLEYRLFSRGVALMATHLDMHEGRLVRVAEADANSEEFNSTILSARREGRITPEQYARVTNTDMIIEGKEIESDNRIFAVIEASYSISAADISKVCSTTTIVKRLFPEAEARAVLYFLNPNERLEAEATDQGVILVRTKNLS